MTDGMARVRTYRDDGAVLTENLIQTRSGGFEMPLDLRAVRVRIEFAEGQQEEIDRLRKRVEELEAMVYVPAQDEWADDLES